MEPCVDGDALALNGCVVEVLSMEPCADKEALALNGCVVKVRSTEPCADGEALALNGCVVKVRSTEPCADGEALALNGCVVKVRSTEPCADGEALALNGCVVKVRSMEPCVDGEALALNGCVVKVQSMEPYADGWSMRLKQHAVIEFLTAESVTPKEIPQRMQAVYGDCVDVSPVRCWASKFKDAEVGTSDLHDKQRVGHPVTATTEFHKQKVDSLIQDDRRITQREISSIIGISQERVGHIIALLGYQMLREL
ncbi:uncharacterized protein LOC134294064 [Anolis carolinensis]|uniref:uncharacterized protein LOC134294064 n=1 Tax=Anolis carolinensis TaxID=28377 RepID=UPI002F2B6EDB